MDNRPVIRLGTRSSPLALAQAAAVAEGLRRLGADVEIIPVKTEGDRLFGARLAELGGKGLFVRELEEALAEGTIDAAVHSLKDLPAEQPDGLVLAAFAEREDPRDVVVTRAGGGLEDLPKAAVVGTSSLRRRAFALAVRPDLVVEPIRGNVDTRMRKLTAGACDALILAAAGLSRLGLHPPHVTPLAPDRFVPAVGQGILGIEVRRDDGSTLRLVRALDHAETRTCALAERAFLRRLGASCATPMAGHAVVSRAVVGARLTMTAVVASEDGRQILRAEAGGAPEDPERLGRGLAEGLLAQGAASVAALNPGRWPS
jgi:hydroxymethylbilane synthase